MTEHFVFIETRPAKGQIDIPGKSKYRVGSCWCRCGWDTPFGIETPMADGSRGIFLTAMDHLEEHDCLGRFQYNSCITLRWRTSLKWLGEDLAYKYFDFLKDAEPDDVQHEDDEEAIESKRTFKMTLQEVKE